MMSGTLIGCSTDAQDLMARPTMYRTLQHSQASRTRWRCARSPAG